MSLWIRDARVPTAHQPGSILVFRILSSKRVHYRLKLSLGFASSNLRLKFAERHCTDLSVVPTCHVAQHTNAYLNLWLCLKWPITIYTTSKAGRIIHETSEHTP